MTKEARDGGAVGQRRGLRWCKQGLAPLRVLRPLLAGGDRRSPCTGPNDAVTRRWDHGTAAVQELGPETPPRACPEEGLACVGARKKKRRMKMWIWPRYWPISSAEAK